MVARRTLIQAAIAATVIIAVVALFVAGRSRRRPPATPDVEPGVQRTVAVFLVMDSTLTNTAAREAMSRVAGRLQTVSGIRVVDAWVRPTADIQQLKDLLNASGSIEAHPRVGNALNVVYRVGDSVKASRDYQFATTAMDSIVADATAILDARFASAAPTADLMASLEVSRRTHVADSLAHAGNPSAAEREFLAAIVASPQTAAPRHRYADFLYSEHRVAEALRQARRAHELNPLSAEIHLAYAALLERSGRQADASRERDEQKRIATILNPTRKDQIARARFKHVPKKPPRPPPSRSSRSPRP